MPRFADALNRSAETIKRPPPLPVGTYIFRVTKQPDPPQEMNTKNGIMDALRVPVAVVSPVEVDQSDLDAFGNVQNQPARIDFLFPREDENGFERTLARFKMFASHCGIDIEDGTFGSWLQEINNCQFSGEIGHRIDPNDESNIYSEIKRTAPVE